MPNVIHSLDAANIVGFINNPKIQELDVFTIHDCFGSVAADSSLVQTAVKYEFVAIYSDKSFISKFHSGCIDAIKTYDTTRYEISSDDSSVMDKQLNKVYKIPQIPQLGNLDLTGVLSSMYMVKP